MSHVVSFVCFFFSKRHVCVRRNLHISEHGPTHPCQSRRCFLFFFSCGVRPTNAPRRFHSAPRGTLHILLLLARTWMKRNVFHLTLNELPSKRSHTYCEKSGVIPTKCANGPTIADTCWSRTGIQSHSYGLELPWFRV